MLNTPLAHLILTEGEAKACVPLDRMQIGFGVPSKNRDVPKELGV